MDDQQRERREQLPEHETRPEPAAGDPATSASDTAEGTDATEPERLAALPDHERDRQAGNVSSDYSEMTTGDREALATERGDPDDMPPVNRSG